MKRNEILPLVVPYIPQTQPLVRSGEPPVDLRWRFRNIGFQVDLGHSKKWRGFVAFPSPLVTFGRARRSSVVHHRRPAPSVFRGECVEDIPPKRVGARARSFAGMRGERGRRERTENRFSTIHSREKFGIEHQSRETSVRARFRGSFLFVVVLRLPPPSCLGSGLRKQVRARNRDLSSGGRS